MGRDLPWQRHGIDDVTGEPLVRREDDQPEVRTLAWLGLALRIEVSDYTIARGGGGEWGGVAEV